MENYDGLLFRNLSTSAYVGAEASWIFTSFTVVCARVGGYIGVKEHHLDRVLQLQL